MNPINQNKIIIKECHEEKATRHPLRCCSEEFPININYLEFFNVPFSKYYTHSKKWDLPPCIQQQNCRETVTGTFRDYVKTVKWNCFSQSALQCKNFWRVLLKLSKRFSWEVALPLTAELRKKEHADAYLSIQCLLSYKQKQIVAKWLMSSKKQYWENT